MMIKGYVSEQQKDNKQTNTNKQTVTQRKRKGSNEERSRSVVLSMFIRN